MLWSIESSNNTDQETSILGDFNVHYKLCVSSPLTDHPGELAFNFVILHDLEQLVQQPTRIPDRLGESQIIRVGVVTHSSSVRNAFATHSQCIHSGIAARLSSMRVTTHSQRNRHQNSPMCERGFSSPFHLPWGFLWVYVIIVLEAYSAKLVAFLTVKRFPEGINTLEELYHSSLPVYGQTPWWVDSLTAAKNVYARKLVSQYSTLTDFGDIYKHLVSGQGVYIASSNNLIYTISLFANNGNPTMRMMKECFQPYNTAMGVQSHSPLKRSLDQAVTWVVQAGLTIPWVRETLLIVRQERIASSNGLADAAVPESDSGVSFSLEHLQGVFIMFGAGCGLSLVVFASEFLL
ncbi:uncharacterized protein LOC135092848 [Scylla paramamosain]|uniref:uncharacterized protein LOC135092848 n=1 Tax=Scylla paramamosain TaxID=85552 RepID=UPI003083A2D8